MEMKMKYTVNVDTLEFNLTGMKFQNPSPTNVTLLNKDTGETKEYGNRVFMDGNGSGNHRMSVRLISGNRLRFSGSPYAHKYGQNIFTASSVLRGCRIAINSAIKDFGINPSQELKDKWHAGDFELLRVDLAMNFRLESEQEINSVLKQIRRQLIEQNGPTRTSGSTVYWNPKNGKQYSIAFYAKGPHLRRSKQYLRMEQRDDLLNEAQTILRVEVRLRKVELEKLGISRACDWKADTGAMVFKQYLAKLKLLSVTSGPVTDDELAKLPSKLRHPLALHKYGADISRIYGVRTLQRILKEFRDFEIDLKCPNQDAGSITSLTKYLSLSKAIRKPPKWMIEAKLVPPSRVKKQRKSCKSINSNAASTANLVDATTSKQKKGKRVL